MLLNTTANARVSSVRFFPGWNLHTVSGVQSRQARTCIPGRIFLPLIKNDEYGNRND